MDRNDTNMEAPVPTAPGSVLGMPRWVQFAILGVATAIILAVALIGPARFGTKSPFTKAAKPPEAAGFRLSPLQWAEVKTQVVREANFQPERQADGRIAIDEDRTTSVFPPYSGRVTALFVREGDDVVRGQPLFSIDSTDLVQAQNDFVAATSAAAKTQSQVKLLQTIEQRAHQLYDAHGGALKDWQQAQADLAAARNDQKSGEIALAAVRDRLRILGQSDTGIAQIAATGKTSPDLIVPAPIAGRVLQRKLGLGQYVSQGATDPVFAIGDLSKVWLVANVRETDAPYVHLGQPVVVRVTAFPNRVFDATITYVAASVDTSTHRMPIRAEVANVDGVLKPEMWADFSIITGAAHKGLAVPAAAIVYEGEAARVWVADKDHRIASRSIRMGITNGANVEVLAGVSAGDRVITQGSIFIDRAATNK